MGKKFKVTLNPTFYPNYNRLCPAMGQRYRKADDAGNPRARFEEGDNGREAISYSTIEGIELFSGDWWPGALVRLCSNVADVNTAGGYFAQTDAERSQSICAGEGGKKKQ